MAKTKVAEKQPSSTEALRETIKEVWRKVISIYPAAIKSNEWRIAQICKYAYKNNSQPYRHFFGKNQNLYRETGHGDNKNPVNCKHQVKPEWLLKCLGRKAQVEYYFDIPCSKILLIIQILRFVLLNYLDLSMSHYRWENA